MRKLLMLFLIAAMLAGCSKSTQSTEETPSAAPSAAVSEAPPSPAETESPATAESPSESASPQESASPEATETAAPTEAPTIPTPPPNLPAGWEKQSDRVENGPEAELVVRTGSIDNLGYGWPEHFTPFSGESTPPHEYPCQPRPGSAPGTDHVMLGSGVKIGDDGKAVSPLEGYSGCSKRPDNLPQAIALQVGTTPAKMRKVFLQVFVDDFQPVPMKSHFQVSLNGTRIPTFEDTVNQLDQTGPIGKLLTLELLPEYWPILKQGTVNLLFDDPTTGNADGYALDFARILVNPHPWPYPVTISCTIVDIDTHKPIKGATCAAAGVTTTVDSAGNGSLKGIPAGLVSVSANAVNYDGATQLLDLPAKQHGDARFQLKRHKDSGLRQQILQTGTVRIYGIHFDTASAKLRPESIASLNEILKLIKSMPPGARWIIAGHTDNQGGADYNMNLSNERAHSVVTWLVQHGISADKLTAKGYGLTRPVADNSTDAGRALNRRVEVTYVK